ncbi:hypothetical protein F4781DRAFT_395889 [Annulohypoxylon bovei var. microspora]|nr:hypothetical protein F4781DRAFT_395889 [Annulohypoxylon bovei var. microspora]
MKWKNRSLTRFTVIFIASLLMSLSLIVSFYSYDPQLSYLFLTFGLFMISLIVRQASAFVRTWRNKPHGLQSEEALQNQTPSTGLNPCVLDAIV